MRNHLLIERTTVVEGGVNREFGIDRCFIRAINAGDILDPASLRGAIQSLRVPTCAFGQWRAPTGRCAGLFLLSCVRGWIRWSGFEFTTGNKKPAEAGFLQDHSNILSVSPPGHGRSSLILCASCAAAVGSNLTESLNCRTEPIAANPCKPFAIDDSSSHHRGQFDVICVAFCNIP